MKFVRTTDIRHTEQSTAYYAASFPFHEQREPDSQARIMSDPEYHYNLIFDKNTEVGTILFWETADYIYIEHFYIYPTCRGGSLGSKALELLRQYGKTVILEIDPPVDDIAVRRKGFYERSGWVANPYPHTHPPYHAGAQAHRLVIMSYPNPLTRTEYDEFNNYLKDHVMADAF